MPRRDPLKKKLSLVLRCAVPLSRGVGRPYGIPALRFGEKVYSAKAASLALAGDALILDDGTRVPGTVLEDLGIGPLGRFIDGDPIVPVKLKPQDILRRGGRDLEGFWTGLELPLTGTETAGTDPGSGPPPGPPLSAAELLFREHLDFLRFFGISGGVVAEPRTSAALLARYLDVLGGAVEDGRVMVLTRRAYYETRLRRELSPLIPVTAAEGVSLFSPRFRGVGLGFYETLPGNLKIRKARCDILILVEPEALSDTPGETGRILGEIGSRVTLGVFLKPPEFPGLKGEIRALLSLRGAMADLGKYAIRDTAPEGGIPGETFPPPYRFEGHIRRRPPRPFSREESPGYDDRLIIAGGGRFVVEGKFKHIRIPEFADEQALFFAPGARAPREPYPLDHAYDCNFNGLSKKQRAYFLYWRGEFRRAQNRDPGRCPGTEVSYICLYARELILSLGNTKPEDNFRELLRLWRSFRETFPELDGVFPRWLLDFAVLYNVWAGMSGELFPHVTGDAPPLLRDLYLHHRYIEHDHPPAFSDMTLILQDRSDFHQSIYGPLLEITAERALAALDRRLRERYGRGLFRFFYPAKTAPVLFEGFPSLYGMGQSSYTAEWIRFCEHRPLAVFLRDIAAYIEYQLRRRIPFPGVSRKPRLEPFWQETIDAELGYTGGGIRLEDHKLDQLRDESDAVRELLRMNGETGEPDPEPRFPPVWEPAKTKALPDYTGPSGPGRAEGPALAEFLEALGEAERETLRGVAGGASPEALRELALRHLSMPELLVDSINGMFYEWFRDILIETPEAGPVLAAEYGGEVKAFFAVP
jgi:hypothetical protein